MQPKQQVIEHIRQAFYDTERRDGVFLQHGSEGVGRVGRKKPTI